MTDQPVEDFQKVPTASLQSLVELRQFLDFVKRHKVLTLEEKVVGEKRNNQRRMVQKRIDLVPAHLCDAGPGVLGSDLAP